jgi:two-component system phosphate regulon sensor histidine kinase PhoR
MRISVRLSVTFLIAAIATVVLAAHFFSRASIRTVEQEYRQALGDIGPLLLEQARLWLTSPDIDADSAVDLAGSGLATRLTVIDTTGLVLGDSQRSGNDLEAMENHARRPEIAAALTGRMDSHIRISATLGIKFLYVAHPVIEQGRVVGVLRLAVPLESVRALENLRTRYTAAGIAAVLAATLLLAAFLGAWFTRPIQRLLKATDAVAKGDYHSSLGRLGPGEIGELGHCVQQIANAMKSTIDRLEADRKTQAAIFSALLDGVVGIAEDGTVLLANAAASSLMSESGDITGRDIFELFRQPDAATLINGVLKGGASGDTEIVLDNQARRVLHLSAIGIHTPGTSLAALLVLTDVTTQVTTLRMRRDFFSNASHELRTPLTSILGYLETLEDQLPQDSPLRERYLDVLTRQAERMRRIIDDLLLLSQVESDQWPVELEAYDLVAQAGRVLESFKPEAEKHEQHLAVQAPPGAVTVMADREKVHVALSNLVDNAIKYAGRGARIEIRIGPSDETVQITVADNGPGIPAAEISRIFERFYRVDKSRSRALGGTGLGLAIVRHILAAHDSEIRVSSDLGEGAEFTFRLRRAAA